ncbi:MAG: aspartate/glutamate racemase family protein [Bacillota bacterium]|nr:aspartate/glutamate racemase family protein [Bacillota bacterium]
MTQEQKREFGYLSGEERESQWIQMRRGQNVAGYSVGILHLDNVWYPLLPGNVANACTYDFPVRLKAVPGLDTPRLHGGDPEIFQALLAAARELEKEGVRAISAACGFFGHFHSQLADAIDVPVALSSLVQIPWIRSVLKREQKIGVLTANASAITEELLKSCGVEDPELLVIRDLRHEEQFSAIMEDRGAFDNAQVRREVVAAAEELVNSQPKLGAILLECSDTPPYAYAVQRATGLPVFDFITMIKWLHSSVNQTPYCGWI